MKFTRLLMLLLSACGGQSAALAQSLLLPEVRAEEANSADPASDLLSVEPIVDDNAGMSLDDAANSVEVTQSHLPFMPQWLKLRAGVGYYYDDNIFLDPDHKVADQTFQYILGATLRSPESETSLFSLDYDLTGFELMDHPEQSAADHLAKLRSGIKFARTTFVFNADYSHLAGADEQVGEFINRDVIAANAAVTRELGTRTEAKLGLTYSQTAYQNLLNTRDAAGLVRFDYLLGSHTRVGISGVFGEMRTERDGQPQTVPNRTGTANPNLSTTNHLSIAVQQQQASDAAAQSKLQYDQLQDTLKQLRETARQLTQVAQSPTATPAQKAEAQALLDQIAKLEKDGQAVTSQYQSSQAAAKKASRRSTQTPDQSYFQALVNLNYEATGKLNLGASFGLDFRRYSGAEAVDARTDFTFTLGADYKLRERTMLSLQAGQKTAGAATLEGTAIDQTTFGLSVHQQIGHRLHLELNGTYLINDFISIRKDINTDRHEDYLTVRAEAKYDLRSWAYVSVFYELRDQVSTEKMLTYQNNRFGVQIGVSF